MREDIAGCLGLQLRPPKITSFIAIPSEEMINVAVLALADFLNQAPQM